MTDKDTTCILVASWIVVVTYQKKSLCENFPFYSNIFQQEIYYRHEHFSKHWYIYTISNLIIETEEQNNKECSPRSGCFWMSWQLQDLLDGISLISGLWRGLGKEVPFRFGQNHASSGTQTTILWSDVRSTNRSGTQMLSCWTSLIWINPMFFCLPIFDTFGFYFTQNVKTSMDFWTFWV